MFFIRPMVISDYPDVYALWLDTKGMGLNNLNDSKDGIAKFLIRNPTTCFVAHTDNKIIGVILAGHDGRRGYIYHLAVHEAHQRQGIGGQLVQHSLHALHQEGITKVALVVFRHNIHGNAFWEKQGFGIRDDLIYRNLSIVDTIRIDT